MKGTNFDFPFTLEDGRYSVEFLVEVIGWTPGERAVRYDRDGSGYPGSGPEFNDVKMFLFVKGNKKVEMPSDFVQYLIDNNPNFLESITEGGFDARQSEYDAAMEAKGEAHREYAMLRVDRHE